MKIDSVIFKLKPIRILIIFLVLMIGFTGSALAETNFAPRLSSGNRISGLSYVSFTGNGQTDAVTGATKTAEKKTKDDSTFKKNLFYLFVLVILIGFSAFAVRRLISTR